MPIRSLGSGPLEESQAVDMVGPVSNGRSKGLTLVSLW